MHEAPKKSWTKVIGDFANPVYHWKRFKEDMVVTRRALAKRKELLAGETHHADYPEIFRGKLMGVFFATGWTNLIGIGLGYVAQKMWSSVWVGLFSTPVLAYVVTAIGFQVGWWLDNRDIYRAAHSDPAHQFWQLQKDMLPVHRAALPFAVVFNFANVLVSGPILALITLVAPRVAQEIPAGAMIILVEFLFIGGSFVRVMGDFFDKYSYRLAAKYHPVLQKLSGT